MKFKLKKSPLLKLSVAASLLLGQLPLAHAQKTLVERPPQYILMSFDGSKEIAMWQYTRDFSKAMAQKNIPVKFTYFISGVYWLTPANKNLYKAPHHSTGGSAIGFGDDTASLKLRIDQVNAAYEDGHEIGSHANGHFDASDYEHKGTPNYAPWSLEDWNSEFQQFISLIFNAFTNNKIEAPTKYVGGYAFKSSNIVGLRAPQLGVTDGLWPSMAQNGYKYDASKVNTSTYWPQKDKYGIWQYPLASLTIAGTAKKTLSMDYNFYVAQSKAVKDEANKELYKKQMLDTYLSYFNSNYYGNRAPLNIGHHFSRWNGAAYWEAMQAFASKVCGKPEVRCVTYTEYTQWLESLAPEKLASFRAGQFEKMPTTEKLGEIFSKPIKMDLNLQLANELLVATSDSDPNSTVTRVSINNNMMSTDKVDLRDLRKILPRGSSVTIGAHVFDRRGIELKSATHVIRALDMDDENITNNPIEDYAMHGDLPEAHNEE